MGISLPKTEEKPDEYEVWPENWPIVMMWCRAANGDGLNYGIIPWLIDEVYKVEDKVGMFEGLQVMHWAFLACRAKEGG